MKRNNRPPVDNRKRDHKIRKLYKTGLRKYSMATLARQFKVCKTTIFNIIHSK